MGVFGAILGLVFQTWTDDKTKALKWLGKGALILYSFQLFDDYLTQPALLPSHIIAPVLGLALFTAQDLLSAQGRQHCRSKLGFLVGFSLISALLFIAGFGKALEYWDSPKAMISGAKICEALKNEACTAHWYLEGAKEGSSEAQCEIGLRYNLGIGLQADKPKGFYWIQKSALQGYTWAEMNLGELYWDADGTNRNVKKGFYWSEKAAHKNIGFAQKRLGDAYLHGWGAPVDLAKAYYWYGRALKGPYRNQLKAYQLGI